MKSEDGEVEKDQTVVAELLAGHFDTVAANIGGNHITSLTENDHRNHSSVKAIEGRYKRNEFDFKEFNKEEVQFALKNLNVRKSYGWDVTAPPKLFKGVAEGIAPSLTRLYNNCIDLGEWPSEWKKGEWTPVFKKGDRQNKLNYRPITSLICVDKIFEHLLSKQVTRHYDPALYHRMTAYRKQHSCETTLLMLIEDWRLAVDRKELVTILSTDMSKAFDSLSHSLTLKKLDAYGFNSSSLELIRSFFDRRLNRVKINGHMSEWRIMERGCPQGSSFGPLLWNMFQNDMALYLLFNTQCHCSLSALNH